MTMRRRNSSGTPCSRSHVEGLGPDDRLGELVDHRLHLALALAEGELDGHGVLVPQTKTFCDSALGRTSAGSMGRPSAMRRRELVGVLGGHRAELELLGVAHQLLDRVVAHEARAAVELHGVVAARIAASSAKETAHAVCEQGSALVGSLVAASDGVPERRGTPDHRARRLDVHARSASVKATAWK